MKKVNAVRREAEGLSEKQVLALKYIASEYNSYKGLIHKNTLHALLRKKMIDEKWNLTKLGEQVFVQVEIMSRANKV